MNIDFLKRLYWACSSEEEHDADEINIGKLYKRIGETEEASRAFSDMLCRAQLEFVEMNSLDRLAGEEAVAYEMQGFINGFRLGMMLVEELREVQE